MNIRFIGDVHGKYRPYHNLIKEVPVSIQVGDMGVGFKRIFDGEVTYYRNPSFDKMSKGDHYFIRGNHDNPHVCKNHKFWIPDGTKHNNVFCVGGAESIDREFRTEGLDWWPEEELSYRELQEIIDIYSEVKPDHVVTHDCPSSIANEILSAFNKVKNKTGDRTRQALEEMFHKHKPKVWIFGHWHVDINMTRNDCEFICLAELSHIDLDIPQ